MLLTELTTKHDGGQQEERKEESAGHRSMIRCEQNLERMALSTLFSTIRASAPRVPTSPRWARWARSISFNAIREEAAEQGVPPDNIPQFVFREVRKEMEIREVRKEMEIREVRKEMEIGEVRKEMEIGEVRKEMEMEMQLLQKDLHFRYKCEISALKLGASNLLQRVLLEAFLEESLPTLRELATLTDREKSALSAVYPKMTVINRILRRSWPECGEQLLPTFSVNGQPRKDFPEMEGRGLLYGQLSERIHSPAMRDVFVRKSEPEAYRALFRALAEKYDRRYEEVDEGEAAVFAYEDKP